MGDAFLGSAYVVYDLDNLQIGLAATQYGVADSFPVEIRKGSVAVTAASIVVSATSVQETNAAASLLPGIGGATSATNSMVTEAPATPAALPTASGVSAGSHEVQRHLVRRIQTQVSRRSGRGSLINVYRWLTREHFG